MSHPSAKRLEFATEQRSDLQTYLDPSELQGQQLVLHLLADGDFSVVIGNHVAGRITSRTGTGGRLVWQWKITGPYIPWEMQPFHGEAKSLLGAETAFREKFNAWLARAKEQGRPVMWKS